MLGGLAPCAACGQLVFGRDGACPHCGHRREQRSRSLPATAKASVVAVLVGVGALGGAACSSTISDSEEGGGGAGGDGGAASTGSATQKTSAATTKSTGQTAQSTTQQSTVNTVASSYGSGPTTSSGGCDNQGNCEGDGSNPYSGCMECAVLGDGFVAVDGGACADEFSACFGDGSSDCTGAGDPTCCQFYDCIDACDANSNGTIDAGSELDCLCTNDGLQCTGNSAPGTCRGDYPTGLQTAVAWEGCLYDDVCPNSCGGN